MEVAIKKTKPDEPSTSRGSGGVKCLLYEAQKQPKYDGDSENVLMSELKKIDPNLGFVHLSKERNKI